MASQASSPSITWKFWLPCPISVFRWLARLLLTRIVKFNHCFGNAASNTSQAQAAVVQSSSPTEYLWLTYVTPKESW